MVAIVLAMLWRQIPGVCTLQRMLAAERILWAQPTKVEPAGAQRALVDFSRRVVRGGVAGRVGTLPRAARRPGPGPSPPRLARVLSTRFAGCYALDGTTLEALFRKLQALQDISAHRVNDV